MPRTNYVKKARKAQGKCEVCGKPIAPGDAYKYIEPRYGPKRVRHTTCRDWRPSETSSSKMTTIWAAQEAFGDTTFTDRADIAAAVNEVAEAARSVGEEYNESAQNIEDGFGHEVPMSEELREKGDELEQWADELESTASDIESGEDVCATCELTEDDDSSELYAHHPFSPMGEEQACAVDGCDVPEEGHHDFEVDLDSVENEASEAIDSCPV